MRVQQFNVVLEQVILHLGFRKTASLNSKGSGPPGYLMIHSTAFKTKSPLTRYIFNSLETADFSKTRLTAKIAL